jgi:hypothetical protein
VRPSDLYTDRLTVQTLDSGRDESAGAKREWSTRATAVPCRIQDASSEWVALFGSLGIAVSHVVFTDRDDLKNGDRLVDEETGLFLLVRGTMSRRAIGTLPTYRVIGAEQVRANA